MNRGSRLPGTREFGSTATFPLYCLLTDQLEVGAASREPSVPLRQRRVSPAKIFQTKAQASAVWEPRKVVDVTVLVSSLASGSPVALHLEEGEGKGWLAALTPSLRAATSGLLLSPGELKEVMVRGLVLAGGLPTELGSLFSLLRGATEGGREKVERAVAEAYLEAHLLGALAHRLLRESVSCLQGSQAVAVTSYMEECRTIVAEHRRKTQPELEDVVQNMMLMADCLTTGDTIQVCLEKSAEGLFIAWKTEVIKNVKARVSSPQKAKFNCQVIERAVGRIDSSVDPMEVCRDVLNVHIYREIKLTYLDYQEMFAGVCDYRRTMSSHLLGCVRDLLQTSRGREQHDSGEARLQMAYDCFEALRRVWECLYPGEPCPAWIYQYFSGYVDKWLKLAMDRARLNVEKLLAYLKENKEEFKTTATAVGAAQQGGGMVMRLDSTVDITNTTLIQFSAIADQCWT